MRSIRFPKQFLAAGLLLLCFLGLPTDAAANEDIYYGLKWEFSIPIKLKNMLPSFRTAHITVKIYDAGGGVMVEKATRYDVQDMSGNYDAVVVLEIDPPGGINPFLAKKYTVDMVFDNNRETPSFNHPKMLYRAKDGTELVYHIEEQMPALDAAGIGNDAHAGVMQ